MALVVQGPSSLRAGCDWRPMHVQVALTVVLHKQADKRWFAPRSVVVVGSARRGCGPRTIAHRTACDPQSRSSPAPADFPITTEREGAKGRMLAAGTCRG